MYTDLYLYMMINRGKKTPSGFSSQISHTNKIGSATAVSQIGGFPVYTMWKKKRLLEVAAAAVDSFVGPKWIRESKQVYTTSRIEGGKDQSPRFLHARGYIASRTLLGILLVSRKRGQSRRLPSSCLLAKKHGPHRPWTVETPYEMTK